MVSGEKRNCEEENGLEKINTILLDIEGTTTPISFVKDTLFPYIRENLKSYVNEHWNDEEFKADLKALKSQAKIDEEEKIENFCPIEEGEKEKETLISNVLWQMDLDRKTTALKQLQGHIWREGYESGKLKGSVYGEVSQVFKKWSEDGHKLYIYSSGSVEAQKLLFKNSECGDLSGFLSGYFDTEVGPKTDSSSYINIAKAIGCDPGQILFLTDVFKEAVAAEKAGFHVMIVIREGNIPLSDDEKKAFTMISSFKEIVFECANKKKKICEEESMGTPTEKVENIDKIEDTIEESKEIKNGEMEKMEMDTTESNQEDCTQDNETEKKDQSKMEPDQLTETPEAESDNVNVDVDDSNIENSEGEKIVSSSVEESENVKQADIEEAEKPSQEEVVEKDESADSTNNENPVSEMDCAEETKDKSAEEEKTSDEEIVVEEKNINGHENGETKENDQKETIEEANGEANGKVEEEIEAVPVKKVNADEPADSTVEVTA